ncbi:MULTISPECIES: glycosyltransferase family 2 protein [unclassified Ornithinimicrobium]|uniref:glycosyltransferase family 2 protein n=1 Tax=unclassified Ornithinimicrobium TaxID=2615080 RepID=UPI003851FC3A
MKNLTIVVPTYNGARYLGPTLDSLHANAIPNLEVIVVDDGSTDASVDIADEHPVVTSVLSQDHAGVAVARNRGLARAESEWVAFLDQDDLWHPGRFRQLHDFVESVPADLVLSRELKFASRLERDVLRELHPDVGEWADDYVSDKDEITELASRHPLNPRPTFTTITTRDVLQGPISTTTSFVAKRTLLQAVGGFAPHARAMDDYITLANASRLTPIYRVEDASVFYRVHLGATSRSTELPLPFLSNSLALQLGGMLVDGPGSTRMTSGPLHAHLYRQAIASDRFWHDSYYRRSIVALGIATFGLRATAPQIARAAARQLRDRGRVASGGS